MARRVSTAALVLFLVAAFGCEATRGRRAEPVHSGFLGDYSQLEQHDDFPEREIFIRPDTDWSGYNSVLLESVTLWIEPDENEDLSDEERQMLTDMLYKAMHEQLSERFEVATRPGPQTIRLRLAFTSAEGAAVVARSISTLLPQMLLLGTAVGLSADTAVTVGKATVEADLRDSVSDRRLAAIVDERAGTKNLFSGRTFKEWGDVEAACQYWAERAGATLETLGVQTRDGWTGESES